MSEVRTVTLVHMGVEPRLRYPQQAVDPTVPLLDLGLAEPPTPDPWHRGWLGAFTCGCIAQQRTDGSTLLRVACAAHRVTGATSGWTCRCGAVGNPADLACAQCGEAA